MEQIPRTLDYATGPPQRHRGLVAAWHTTVFVGFMGFALMLLVGLRGMGPGSIFSGLLIVNAVIMAPSAAFLLGMKWRRYFLALGLLLLVPPAIADGYCTLEERLFVRQSRTLPPTAPTVFKPRWWPNENSYLYYEPSNGDFGGGD